MNYHILESSFLYSNDVNKPIMSYLIRIIKILNKKVCSKILLPELNWRSTFLMLAVKFVDHDIVLCNIHS